MGLAAHIRPLTDVMPLAYAFDPAFELPEPVIPVGASDEEAAKVRAKAISDYLEGPFRSASERLDYAAITKPGDSPTLFYCRPLTDSETRRIRGIGSISDIQLAALVVRITLQRVENGGELAKIERKQDPEFPYFGKLISLPYMELLGGVSVALGRFQGEITNQIGLQVFERSLNLDPK